MSNTNLDALIEKLKEWEDLEAEAKAEAEATRDAIKAELVKRETETIETERYTVRWTSVLSQRFDTTAFKKELPELYGRYTKQIASRRFSVSA